MTCCRDARIWERDREKLTRETSLVCFPQSQKTLTICLYNPFLPSHSISIFHFFNYSISFHFFFKLFHSILFFHFFQSFKPFHSIPIFSTIFFNFPNPYTISLNLNHSYHLEISKVKPFLHHFYKPFSNYSKSFSNSFFYTKKWSKMVKMT